MGNQTRTIPFVTEDGEEVLFYIIEDTKINGEHYLLVSDEEEEDVDAEAFIMKEILNKEEKEYATYEFVEDEVEMNAVAKIFSELLDDTDIVK